MKKSKEIKMINKLSMFTATVITASTFVGCNSSSSDSNSCTGTEKTSERLFLQSLSDDSVIIKWRGDASTVCVGTDKTNLRTLIQATSTAGNHKEAKVTGLKPDTKYYYSVGAASAAPNEQVFKTAPTTGYPSDDKNTRIWVLGDTGTAGYIHDDSDVSIATETHYDGVVAGVRDGMKSFTAKDKQNIDMLLMLGDNAYNYTLYYIKL